MGPHQSGFSKVVPLVLDCSLAVAALVHNQPGSSWPRGKDGLFSSSEGCPSSPRTGRGLGCSRARHPIPSKVLPSTAGLCVPYWCDGWVKCWLVRFTNTNWCVQMFWFLLLVGVLCMPEGSFHLAGVLSPRIKQKGNWVDITGASRCYGIRDVYASNKALWYFYRNVADFSVPALSSRPISTLASVGASTTRLTRSNAALFMLTWMRKWAAPTVNKNKQRIGALWPADISWENMYKKRLSSFPDLGPCPT